jgi:hypothetical protein
MTGEISLNFPFIRVHLSSHRNYTTVAQPGLGGRAVPYPRGMHDHVRLQLELIENQAKFLAGAVRLVRTYLHRDHPDPEMAYN